MYLQALDRVRERKRVREPTLVFQKVAHARAPREDELRHILDNLGLVLGREGGEPLGETLMRVRYACDLVE